MLLTIGALTVGVIALGLGRPAGPRPASRPRRRSAAALEWGALLLLCAALFFRPYEAVVAGSDASVYVSFGRKIAEAGALVFEDKLVRGLPAEAARSCSRTATAGFAGPAGCTGSLAASRSSASRMRPYRLASPPCFRC